jgi:integrase
MESQKKWKAVPSRSKGTWIANCLQANSKQRTTRTLGRLDELNEVEAQKKADRLADEHESEQWTVNRVIERYEHFAFSPHRFGRNQSMREVSIVTYRNFHRHIRQQFGHLPLTSLLAGVVEEWLVPLDLAQNTKKQIANALGRLWQYAAKRGMVSQILANPMQYVTIDESSIVVNETVPMSKEEFWAFESWLERPYSIIALVSEAHGLRIGEARAFKWFDYRPLEATLTVERDIVRGRVHECKTPESQKVLKLGPKMIGELESWKRETPYAEPSDWIFASPYRDGATPYSQTAITQAYERAAKAIGLKRWNTHIMRHTHCHWAEEYLGAHPEAQRQSMRHKLRATTERYGRGRKRKQLSPAAQKLQLEMTELAFEGRERQLISGDFKTN